MAWETRRRGGRYYTRSQRRNGRILREYVGSGLFGELCAEKDAEGRAERKRQRDAWLAEQEEFEALDARVSEVDEACAALMRDALEQAGYYQHKRGEWRKRRG